MSSVVRVFRPVVEGASPDPLLPVCGVGLDLSEEPAGDRLRDAFALLPGAHGVDIHAQEPRQYRLTRPEQSVAPA